MTKKIDDEAQNFESQTETQPDQIIPTTPKELKEVANKLTSLQPRGADGKFLSKTDKAPTMLEKRKAYVERTVDKVAGLLEIPYEQLKLEPRDDAETAMIKCLILGVYNASDEKGGLGAKVKVWEAVNKVLGLGTVDKEEKSTSPFSIVLVDPFAGLTPEEKKQALLNAREHVPLQTKTKPSWVDAEVLSTNPAPQQYLDGDYHPDKSRGSA